MKVSLVYPKLGGQFSRAVGLILGSSDPPLGIMFLGTFLKKKGIDVNLIDLSFSKDWSDYEKELLKEKPDLVGITSLSPFAEQASEAASITRKVLPNSKIIMGGPHPTILPLETIKSPHIDFVIIGEGEETLLDLIQTLEKNGEISRVKGIVYKKDGKIYQNPLRPFIQNLDEISFPLRDLLPTWEKYLSQIPFFPYVHPYTTLIGTRGCPFNCSFCQPVLRKIFGQVVRHRSPENIFHEVKYLVDQYKIKSLFFFDDTFTAIPRWVEKICDLFIQNNLRIWWGINSRVNTFSYPLAKKLKEAGCIYVSFGVESGSQKILTEILNKGITIEQIINAFEVCKKVGLISSASLMIGSPGDTRETIQETIDLVKKIKPDKIDVHYTTPTPGSFMYERVKDTLLIPHIDRYNAGALKLSDLSNQDLKKLHDELQIEWRKSKGKSGYYNSLAKTYLLKNLPQGIKRPLQYLVVILDLAAENNSLVYKLLMMIKDIYKKLLSFRYGDI